MGWLTTRYSFSFAHWFDPKRMGFGVLRVLNDDRIAARSGFGEHSHANFEIITIVQKGAVTHKDSLGNTKKVSAGEVQVMSAGRGVTHAELNNESEFLELFQIWIEPNVLNVEPRYDQKSFSTAERKDVWQTIVSNGSIHGSLAIYQDAFLSLIEVSDVKPISYTLKKGGNGVFLFVIEGVVVCGEHRLDSRDALAIQQTQEISIQSSKALVLAIEVPMKNGL